MFNTVFSIALQVYLASLAQLLVVLLIVVSLTEVKEVRDFQRQHNWIWALASGEIRALFKHQWRQITTLLITTTIMFLFLWVNLIICFPTVRETPKYNFLILLFFTVLEGLLLGD